MKMIGVAIARRSGQPQARQAVQEDRQRDAHFQSRQGRADAEVNAAAERHVRIGRAAWIETVRFGEDQRVAIGGAEQQADPIALTQSYSRDLDVLQRVACEEMQRRIEPQQFFDHRLVDPKSAEVAPACSSIALRPLPMPWTVAS